MVITTAKSRWWSLFKYDNGYIRNVYDKRVIDVAKNEEGEQVSIF
jgi:hypothetical protein